MKLDDIFEMWKKDCEIDMTQLDVSQAEAAKNHHKYIQILARERLLFKKYEAQYKILKEEKTYFLTEGPFKEYLDRGWRFPDRGQILKADINRYLESDQQIIEHQLKMGMQQEKLSLLESILYQLNGRSYMIKNILEWKKLQLSG